MKYVKVRDASAMIILATRPATERCFSLAPPQAGPTSIRGLLCGAALPASNSSQADLE
jgi:hypothetical protein